MLDAVYRAFYKQSMMQSDVRKLCVHPTWLICSEYFEVNVFDKMKLNLLHDCSHVWAIDKFECFA